MPRLPQRERRGARADAQRGGRAHGSPSVEEAVADAPHGEEMPRVGRILLEALAQAQDEVVDRAGGGKHVVAPDPLEQVLARDDLAGVLGEHLEDHRFLLGELLRLAVPGARAEGAEVHFVAAEAQHRRGGRAEALRYQSQRLRIARTRSRNSCR